MIFELMFKEEFLTELICKYFVTKKNSIKNEIITNIKNKNIHWDKFENIVRENKLESIILASLEYISINGLIPQDTINKFKKRSIYMSLEYVKHQNKSTKILKKIFKANIDFIVMKAFLLYPKLFNNKIYRNHVDLDILTPISLFRDTADVLVADGYKYCLPRKNYKESVGIPDFSFYLPESQEIFKKDNHTIEIHSTVVDNYDFYLDFEQNLNLTKDIYKSEYIYINGFKIKIFTPNELLLSLFLHLLFQHNLQGRISYIEIAEFILIKKRKIDWDYIFIVTQKYKIQSLFLLFLLLFNNSHPGVLPRKVINKVTAFKSEWGPAHKIVFFYFRYKVFHKTNFLANPTREAEKEWLWAVMSNRTIRLFLFKIRGFVFKRF